MSRAGEPVRGVRDLSGVVAAVPGRRAGRLLLAALVEEARGAGVGLSPPRIVPEREVGALVAGVPERRCACAGLVNLAWGVGVRGLSAEGRAALGAGRVEDDDPAAWAGVGAMVRRSGLMLAEAGLEWGEAYGRVSGLAPACERARWEAASRAQAGASAWLAGLGLVDRALEAARLVHAGRWSFEGELLVLVAEPDPSGVTRRVLAGLGERGVVLVAAPESEAGRFDGVGRPVPERWGSESLGGVAVEFVDGPADQAAAALEAVDRLMRSPGGERVSGDRVTIGVPDPAVAWWVMRFSEGLRERGGLEVHEVGGTRVRQTGPWLLVRAAQELVAGGEFERLSTLVRHPAMEAWLRRELEAGRGERWLAEMDRLAARGVWSVEVADEVTGGGSGRASVAGAVWKAVRGWLGGLWERRGERAAMREWSLELRRALDAVYGEGAGGADGPGAALGVVRAAAEGLAVDEPSTAAGFLGLVLAQTADEAVAPEPESAAAELLGWHELLTDPAEVLVLTGLNEGSVPESAGADGLTPDRVRMALGLSCDRARAARDAYVLWALVRGGRRVALIAGRRDDEGGPLKPSRLLMGGSDREAVDVVRAWVGEGAGLGEGGEAGGGAAVSGFAPMPEGRRRRAAESMTVTSFRRYLSSPYHFYLVDVLGLDAGPEREEGEEELEARALGELMHDALKAWGRDGAPGGSDAGAVRGEMLSRLEAVLSEKLGPTALTERAPVVLRLQVADARRWLERLADWQAVAWSEGWRVRHVEWEPASRVRLEVDGVEVEIRGAIDRIDRNEVTGAWRVIDYKTSRASVDPARAHVEKVDGEERWKDLQLPLYWKMVRERLAEGCAVEVGYVGVVGEDGVGFVAAGWGETEMGRGLEAARAVVRAVRAGRFFEAGPRPPEAGPVAGLLGVSEPGRG